MHFAKLSNKLRTHAQSYAYFDPPQKKKKIGKKVDCQRYEKKRLFFNFYFLRSLEKGDFLEKSHVLSCFVQLKNVLFNLLCVLDLFLPLSSGPTKSLGWLIRRPANSINVMFSYTAFTSINHEFRNLRKCLENEIRPVLQHILHIF